MIDSFRIVRRLKFKLHGFTVVELLVALGIVVILAVMIFRLSGGIIGSISRAGCMANLRALHTGFSGYLQDHQVWPQLPEVELSNEAEEEFWMSSLDPYLDTRKVWLCPYLARAKLADPSGQVLKMHYIPTRFDANKSSPYRWSTQPWAIEMSDAHGVGSLILFPDGSIRGLKEILKR